MQVRISTNSCHTSSELAAPVPAPKGGTDHLRRIGLQILVSRLQLFTMVHLRVLPQIRHAGASLRRLCILPLVLNQGMDGHSSRVMSQILQVIIIDPLSFMWASHAGYHSDLQARHMDAKLKVVEHPLELQNLPEYIHQTLYSLK
jgi:hypothetical protein